MLFLTLLRESLFFALHALRVNRLRTILSLLGITIGIFAIIAVFTAVDSMENKIRNSVKSLGENVVYIQKWPWTPEDGQEYTWWKYMNRPVPRINEYDEVSRRLSLAQAVVYTVNSKATVTRGTSNVENTTVVAATFDYNQVKSFDLSAELLRVLSPSAEVQGHGPGQKVTVPGKRNVAIVSMIPTGNYAVRIGFDDMHDTGIYTWTYLRELGERAFELFSAYEVDLKEKGMSRDVAERPR